MIRKLKGNAGDGNIILGNWSKFIINNSTVENNCYSFNLEFNGQEGHIYIALDNQNNILEDTTLDLNFPKSLGLYNDASLRELSKKILATINIVAK